VDLIIVTCSPSSWWLLALSESHWRISSEFRRRRLFCCGCLLFLIQDKDIHNLIQAVCNPRIGYPWFSLGWVQPIFSSAWPAPVRLILPVLPVQASLSFFSIGSNRVGLFVNQLILVRVIFSGLGIFLPVPVWFLAYFSQFRSDFWLFRSVPTSFWSFMQFLGCFDSVWSCFLWFLA